MLALDSVSESASVPSSLELVAVFSPPSANSCSNLSATSAVSSAVAIYLASLYKSKAEPKNSFALSSLMTFKPAEAPSTSKSSGLESVLNTVLNTYALLNMFTTAFLYELSMNTLSLAATMVWAGTLAITQSAGGFPSASSQPPLGHKYLY